MQISHITPVAFMGCATLTSGAGSAQLFQAWFNLDKLFPEYVKTRALKPGEVLIRCVAGCAYITCACCQKSTTDFFHCGP